MNETVRDRIVVFQKETQIPMRMFESMIGVSNAYFKQLRNCPSPKILDRIFETFPNLNKMWVLTGEGSIYNTEPSEGKNDDKVVVTDSYARNLIESLTEQVEYLKSQLEKKDQQIENLLKLCVQ